MGRVLVNALIENLDDRPAERLGVLGSVQVRKIEVNDALVVTGATGLVMPKKLIAELGLTHVRNSTYRGVRLMVQGRDCILDVRETDEGNSIHIGRTPLLAMDWVVDRQAHKLIGNLAHGCEQMIEVF